MLWNIHNLSTEPLDPGFRIEAPMVLPMTLVVLDQQAVFLRGLELIFGVQHASVHVIAVSTDVLMAVPMIEARHPDLLLVDLLMPGGFQVIETVTRQSSVPVVAFSASEDLNEVVHALRSGASGFLPKAQEPEDLVVPLQLMLKGWAVMPQIVHRYAIEAMAHGIPIPQAQDLSIQQLDVWCMIGHGWTDEAIAIQMTISERTAKRYVRETLRIIGAKNRVTGAALAGQAGLLLVDPYGSINGLHGLPGDN